MKATCIDKINEKLGIKFKDEISTKIWCRLSSKDVWNSFMLETYWGGKLGDYDNEYVDYEITWELAGFIMIFFVTGWIKKIHWGVIS